MASAARRRKNRRARKANKIEKENRKSERRNCWNTHIVPAHVKLGPLKDITPKGMEQ